jgi:hypothetical protein
MVGPHRRPERTVLVLPLLKSGLLFRRQNGGELPVRIAEHFKYLRLIFAPQILQLTVGKPLRASCNRPSSVASVSFSPLRTILICAFWSSVRCSRAAMRLKICPRGGVAAVGEFSPAKEVVMTPPRMSAADVVRIRTWFVFILTLNTPSAGRMLQPNPVDKQKGTAQGRPGVK